MSANASNAKNNHARLTALRNAIRAAFPDAVYTGKVTPEDDQLPPGPADQDLPYADEKLLHAGLHGRKWSELRREFLRGMEADLELLTNEAWVAFLAAWLMSSLEDVGRRDNVGLILVCSLEPRRDTWMTDRIVNRLRSLNREQRAVLRSVLAVIGESDPSVRGAASEAAKLIDSLE